MLQRKICDDQATKLAAATGSTGASTRSKRDDVEAAAEHGGDFQIVGVGASAGGLEALETFLSRAPADSGMAFGVVQHLDPKHKGATASTST